MSYQDPSEKVGRTYPPTGRCPNCQHPLATVRTGTKAYHLLHALKGGDLSNRALSEALDEISSYTARTMAELIELGYAQNLRPGKGRVAIYHITEAGLDAIGVGRQGAIRLATGEATR